MDRYVVGFAFTLDSEKVLLILKTHPPWQAGKWNGIGGHIEPGETPVQAMIRESQEEAGLTNCGWSHYATMVGDDFECFVFSGWLVKEPYEVADSGEALLVWKLPLTGLPRIANLDFLIAAAQVRHSFREILIHYGKNGDTGQTTEPTP